MIGESPLAGAAIASLEASLAGGEAAGVEPSFYEELRDGFAKDMVEQFNTGDVVLVKPSQVVVGASPLNPYSGETTRTPRNAIVTGYPSDQIDDDRILAGDRRVLMDAADFTEANAPAGVDSVEIDGKLHALVSLKAVPAAGVAVIYILQARTAGRAA